MRILLDDVECYADTYNDWQQLIKEYVASEDRKGKTVPRHDYTALVVAIVTWILTKTADEAWNLCKESIFPDVPEKPQEPADAHSAEPRQALLEKLKMYYEGSAKSEFGSFDEFLTFAIKNSVKVRVILESDVEFDLENAMRERMKELRTVVERTQPRM